MLRFHRFLRIFFLFLIVFSVLLVVFGLNTHFDQVTWLPQDETGAGFSVQFFDKGNIVGTLHVGSVKKVPKKVFLFNFNPVKTPFFMDVQLEIIKSDNKNGIFWMFHKDGANIFVDEIIGLEPFFMSMNHGGKKIKIYSKSAELSLKKKEIRMKNSTVFLNDEDKYSFSGQVIWQDSLGRFVISGGDGKLTILR